MKHPGGTLYNGLYGEALCERTALTFFRLQVYERKRWGFHCLRYVKY